MKKQLRRICFQYRNPRKILNRKPWHICKGLVRLKKKSINQTNKKPYLNIETKRKSSKDAFGLILCELWALGLSFRVACFPSETPLEKCNLLFSIGCQLEIVSVLSMDMYVQCSRTPIWLRSLWAMDMWPPFLWFHLRTCWEGLDVMVFSVPPDSYTLSVFAFVYSLSLERRALMETSYLGLSDIRFLTLFILSHCALASLMITE